MNVIFFGKLPNLLCYATWNIVMHVDEAIIIDNNNGICVMYVIFQQYLMLKFGNIDN